LDSIGEPTVVDFYLPESDPSLFVKQCYMAIEYFESLPNINHAMVHDIQSQKYNYSAWNLALGRVLVDCPTSRDGWCKHVSHQSATAYDGIRMQDHLKKINDPVLNYWQAGLDILSNRIGTDKNLFGIYVVSRRWEICNFKPAQS